MELLILEFHSVLFRTNWKCKARRLKSSKNSKQIHINGTIVLKFTQPFTNKNPKAPLGAVHKLRLQEEGVGGQKNWLFVNHYDIENANGGG